MAARKKYGDWRDNIPDEHLAKAKEMQGERDDLQKRMDASDALPEGHEDKMDASTRALAQQQHGKVEARRTRLLAPYKEGKAPKRESSPAAPVASDDGYKGSDWEGDLNKVVGHLKANSTFKHPETGKTVKGVYDPETGQAASKAALEGRAAGHLMGVNHIPTLKRGSAEPLAGSELPRGLQVSAETAAKNNAGGRGGAATPADGSANASPVAGLAPTKGGIHPVHEQRERPAENMGAIAERNASVKAAPTARTASADEIKDHALRMGEWRQAHKDDRGERPVAPTEAHYSRPADFGQPAERKAKADAEQKAREKAARAQAAGGSVVNTSTGRVDAASSAQPRRGSTPRAVVESPQFSSSNSEGSQPVSSVKAHTTETPGSTHQGSMAAALSKAGIQGSPAPAANPAPHSPTPEVAAASTPEVSSATSEARSQGSTSRIGTPQNPHNNSLVAQQARQSRDNRQRRAVTSLMPGHKVEAPLAVSGARYTPGSAEAPQNRRFVSSQAPAEQTQTNLGGQFGPNKLPQSANVQISPVNTVAPTARAHRMHESTDQVQDVQLGRRKNMAPPKAAANAAPQAPTPAASATPAAPGKGGIAFAESLPKDDKGKAAKVNHVTGFTPEYDRKDGSVGGAQLGRHFASRTGKAAEAQSAKLKADGPDKYWADRDAKKAASPAKAAKAPKEAVVEATSTPAEPAPSRTPVAQKTPLSSQMNVSPESSNIHSNWGPNSAVSPGRGSLAQQVTSRYSPERSETPVAPAPKAKTASKARATGRVGTVSETVSPAPSRSAGGSSGGARPGLHVSDHSVGGDNHGTINHNDYSNHSIYNVNYGTQGNVGHDYGTSRGGGRAPSSSGRGNMGHAGGHEKADVWVRDGSGTHSLRGTIDHVTGRTNGAGHLTAAAKAADSHGGTQKPIAGGPRSAASAPTTPLGTGTTSNWQGPQGGVQHPASGIGTANHGKTTP